MFSKRFYMRGIAICTLLCTAFTVSSSVNAKQAPTLSTSSQRVSNIMLMGAQVGAVNSTAPAPGDILSILSTIDCNARANQAGYYTADQPLMSCTKDPYCKDLWHCHKDCLKEGYTDGITYNSSTPVKKSPEYTCEEPCMMHGKFYWKCAASKCADGYTAESECARYMKFTPVASTHRSGEEVCGTCVENTKPCAIEGSNENYKTLSEINEMMSDSIACYNCSLHHTAPGKTEDIKCYTCSELKGYRRTGDMNSNTCYKYINMEVFGPEGNITCSKRLLFNCPLDEYLTGKKAEGGNVSIEMSNYTEEAGIRLAEQHNSLVGCQCIPYEYELSVSPDSLTFTAAGGSQIMTVTALRKGPSVKQWDFDFSLSSDICSATRIGGGNQLQISCGRNPSNETKIAVLHLSLTHLNGVKDEISKQIQINPDACPSGQSLTASCENNLVLQKSSDFSHAGQPCYKCVADVCPVGQFSCGRDQIAESNGSLSPSGKPCYNCKADVCPDGYTAGTAPNSEDYDITYTESGKPCFKKIERPLPDLCPTGYSTEVTNCDKGYRLDIQGTTNGKNCARCVMDTVCPVVTGCFDYPYCPATKANCEGKVKCSEIPMGNVIKYHSCVCDTSVSAGCSDSQRYDSGICGCVDADCSEGYDKNVKSCGVGENLVTDPNNSQCKRCEPIPCPAGARAQKYAPALGMETPGNPNVSCTEIQCCDTNGAGTRYTNCVCNLTDAACGKGKTADVTTCECKDCPGTIVLGLSSAERYVCTGNPISCGGQMRYNSTQCTYLGSQWVKESEAPDCSKSECQKDVNNIKYCNSQVAACNQQQLQGCSDINRSWLNKEEAFKACGGNSGYDCEATTNPPVAPNGESCYKLVPTGKCASEGYTLTTKPSSATDTYSQCKYGGGFLYKCKDGYSIDSSNKCVKETVASCTTLNSSWVAESYARTNCTQSEGYTYSSVNQTAPNGDKCFVCNPYPCPGYNLDLEPASNSDKCKKGGGYVYKCKDGYTIDLNANTCVAIGGGCKAGEVDAAVTCTKEYLQAIETGKTNDHKCYTCNDCGAAAAGLTLKSSANLSATISGCSCKQCGTGFWCNQSACQATIKTYRLYYASGVTCFKCDKGIEKSITCSLNESAEYMTLSSKSDYKDLEVQTNSALSGNGLAFVNSANGTIGDYLLIDGCGYWRVTKGSTFVGLLTDNTSCNGTHVTKCFIPNPVITCSESEMEATNFNICKSWFGAFITFSDCHQEPGTNLYCPRFNNATAHGQYTFENCPEGSGYTSKTACKSKEKTPCQPIDWGHGVACYVPVGRYADLMPVK